MKRLLNTTMNVKDDHILTGFLIFLVLAFLLYLFLVYYTVFDFLHRDDFRTRDVFVYGAGLKLHKRLMAYRRQIFGKH